MAGSENRKLNISMLTQGVCFVLYFFAFQLTEFTVNDRAALLLGADKVNFVYSVGIACTALGYLAFPLAKRFVANKTGQRAFGLLIGAFAIAASMLVVMASNAVLFLVCSFAALISFGCIGGNVHYMLAKAFQGSNYVGRVVGVAAGLAVAMQFVVQNLLKSDAAYIVSIVLSVALLELFTSRTTKVEACPEFSSDFGKNKTNRSVAVALVSAVLLMSLLMSLIDGVVVSLHSAGKVSVSSWPRLFYAFGLVLAGFVADIGMRRFLSLATVCFMFLSTISTAFLVNPGTYFWCAAFMYLYSGFYVIFLTVMFVAFAPETGNPPLWAGMGRVARSLTTAFCAIPTVWLFDRFGGIALIIASCLLSIGILLVLFRDVSRAVMPRPNTEMTSLTKSERLSQFAKQYRLTPKELEVTELLVSGDDGVQQIADGLQISRRVLQRYISSIYEKTETKSRMALFRLIYDPDGEKQ